MNWNKLKNEEQLNNIIEESHKQAVLIFKHSTSCAISGMALNRLERAWDEHEMATLKPYYLDLLAYRPVSNAIAQQWGIEHQSPQVLVIKNGECIYNTSHMAISYSDIKAQL